MGYKKSRIAPLKCDPTSAAANLGMVSTVWNLLIGVLAQPGHDRSNAISLQNDFIVEGEHITGCILQSIASPAK
jgi:hypothetical protein